MIIFINHYVHFVHIFSQHYVNIVFGIDVEEIGRVGGGVVLYH